ncbi:TIGR03118 family protein [Thermoactinospora rubra]|uniref:TIGR03118 family protein n=1 Tax=Thermoactinospora rubra TaxID=1088767 RepID=UPI000A1014D5|nr:TIGR03118 family protein [Thermoactinospora rubra]
MQHRIMTLCAATIALGALLAPPAEATTTRARFEVVNLVSDVKGKAAVHDPKVVNPWGLAMGKTLWVANTGTGTATVYSGQGRKEATEVAVPGGAPTGQVANTSGEGFTVKGKPATFIFASPSGAITGWNAEADPANAVIGAFTRGADYKGLAMLETDEGRFLLAADFAGGRIHAFDDDFRRVRLARWQFRDPFLPDNYHPFNVSVINDAVWVSYALRDPNTGKAVPGRGKGFVSRFTEEGRLTGRIGRGPLNAPWAVTLAPRDFGAYSGALLIGNFGDGTVHVFKRGRHLGPLRQANGQKIVLPGLWDLEPGTAETGGTNALWFAAGIDGAKHGLVGMIRPAGSGPAVQPTPSSSPSQSQSGNQRQSQEPPGGY